MAETRREIEWASFMMDRTRLSNQGMVPAVASSSSTKLYLDVIDGLAFLTIEDAAFPRPTSVPWTNIASVGWAPDAPKAKPAKKVEP